MDRKSTPEYKKSTKKSKPSRKVIENILHYSASLSVIAGIAPVSLVIVNN